jgi:hypothetical protein
MLHFSVEAERPTLDEQSDAFRQDGTQGQHDLFHSRSENYGVLP